MALDDRSRIAYSVPALVSASRYYLRMKVFISFSGARSHAAAKVLDQYLRFILQSVQPFLSSHDIGSGTRWITELTRGLDESSFGIICLTPENLHADWVLFEAGALAKHYESRACCLLFAGLKPANITDPLSQFQNRVFNKEDVMKLLTDINDLLPSPLRATDLAFIFERWWPGLERDLAAALQTAGDAVKPPRRDASEILDEVLGRIRSLELNMYERLNNVLRAQAPPRTEQLNRIVNSFLYSLSPEQWRVIHDLVTPDGELVELSIDELEQVHDRRTIYSLMQSGFVVWHGEKVAIFSEDIAKRAARFNPPGKVDQPTSSKL